MGSKYVQADIMSEVNNIVKDLKNGFTVLFCGAPCYVAAIKKYVEQFRVDTKRLILVDFICHGTMSPKIYNDYIEKCKEKGEVKDFKFRDKRICGWGGLYSRVIYSNGVSLVTKGYLDAFQRDTFHRDSCYCCKWNTLYRPSDITIGDYWGVSDYQRSFYDSMGVSCVMGNTRKGRALLSCVLKNFGDLIETPIEKALQRPLVSQLSIPETMELEWEKYFLNGIDGILEEDIVAKIWKWIPLTLNIKFLRVYYKNVLKNSVVGMFLRNIRNKKASYAKIHKERE